VSSTHSELLALAECCGFSIFLRGLIEPLVKGVEVGLDVRTKPSVFTDSKNIVDLLNATVTVSHPTERRLTLFIEQMREFLVEGEIDSINHVEGVKNLADMLTKDVRQTALMNVLAGAAEGWTAV